MSATASPASLTHLAVLESESIHVIRELAAEFERLVLMFAVGKDSIVMLRLAEPAFAPAKIPFGLLQVDTDFDFTEMDTVEKIIDEISLARHTERGATRGDDRFSEAALEDRKKEGYF